VKRLPIGGNPQSGMKDFQRTVSMGHQFQPDAAAMLIGSQPLKEHKEAIRLVLEFTPDIPNWVQLPAYRNEGMVDQFMDGLPGLVRNGQSSYVDITAEDFDQQTLSFFEEYLQVVGQEGPWDQTRFVLTPEFAPGFFSLLDGLDRHGVRLKAVKGQVTGPITFCTALHDQEQRAIFYHDTLRDAAVKLLALKAAWQAKILGRFGVPVIIFIDEPALAGYGSSEFISISREDIATSLKEVIDAVHGQGALAGVHVCANTDWSLLLDSEVDIVNFDAHGYFDKLVLYAEPLKKFVASGRFLAWGLVPTLRPEQIEAATVDGLWQDWKEKTGRLADMGMDPATVRTQSLITPSCGTGSLTPELSRKVLELTRGLSRRIQQG
jgi:methionine synthase II (cobalamin-independent)